MTFLDIISEITRLFFRPIIVFPLINIISISICFLLFGSKIKSHFQRHLFTVLITIFIISELICLIVINKFIGYELLIHFNINDFLHMFIFYKKIVFIMLMVAVITNIAFFKLYNLYDRLLGKLIGHYTTPRIYKIIKSVEILLICLSTTLMCTESKDNIKGIILKKIEALKILYIDDVQSFHTSLIQLDMDGYVEKDDLVVNGTGKNVIIISLESFESSFIKNRQTSLTPYFQELMKRWNYYTIKPNIGSNWTSGALYTMMTGVPALFGINHNSIFHHSVKSNFTSLPTIFDELNYEKIYINDNADFSGTRGMLSVFNFDKIIDEKIIKANYDKDIFDAAKNEIIAQIKKDNKFLLILSTLDTHAPHGRYDKRFKEIFSEHKGIKYPTSIINYLVEDFIEFLENNNLLENTVVNILPDHLFMGNPTFITENGNRELFFITNSKLSKKFINQNSPFYQVDIPGIILDASNISHNAKFFSNYYDCNMDSLIRIKHNDIKSLNISGFTRIVDHNRVIKKIDIKQSFQQNKSKFIAHGGGEIKGDIYTNSLESLNYNYDLGVRYFELDILETSDNQLVAVHDWKEWSGRVTYKYDLPPDHKAFMNARILDKYTPLDMQIINDWFKIHSDAFLVTDKINNPTDFILKFHYNERLIMELFNIDTIRSAIKNNISTMASENVVKELMNDQEQFKKLSIDYIAISAGFMNANVELLSELKDYGIKSYVYGMNDYFWNQNFFVFNEKIFFEKYSDIIHGIYVDSFVDIIK